MPVPRGPWVMAQSWRDLLFAHWAVAPETLRAVVPPELELETFDGQAWLGVTPFVVRGLRPRFVPPLPGLSSFPEVNVRTYVTAGGRPGIWFLSLDAASGPAVAAARRLYRLPYFRARMRVHRDAEAIAYASTRVSAGAPAPAALRAHYRPTGPPRPPSPGTLEHWLTERYCLYVVDGAGRVLRGDIAHPPWPLQPAAAHIEVNTMGAEAGLALDDPPAQLHFARRQDVRFWPLRPTG
jgi:uncharacterized protein YqjF (DUF2071 family)